MGSSATRSSASPRTWARTGVTWLVVGALIAVGCRGDDDADTDVVDDPTTDVTTSSTVPRPSTGELAIAAGVPPPPAPAPIAPTIRVPGGVTRATVGSVTTIGADVLADTTVAQLTAVELWDGDRLVESYTPAADLVGLQTSFGWIPARSGLHVLAVRAIGSDGSVVSSMPLWIRVADPIGLADVSPEGMVGQSVGPVATSTERAPAPPFPRAAVDPDTCTLAVEVVPDPSASAIAVSASVMGGSGGPIVIGVVGPEGGRVDARVGGAPMSVSTLSYDDAVSWSGPPQLVEPPPGCVEDGWSGEVALVDGRLLTETPVEAAYLYLSVDGGSHWQRVPADDQTFVPAAPGGADFTEMLPAVPGGGVAIVEAWGWSGGSLVSLGRGVWEPSTDDDQLGAGDLHALPGLWTPAESDLDWITPVISSNTFEPTGAVTTRRSGTICTFDPPASIFVPRPSVTVTGNVSPPPTTTPTTGPSGIPVLPTYCTNYPSGAYSTTFRWMPTLPFIDGGLVQVSSRPIPAGPSSNFPGLMYTSAIPAPTGGFVDFEIPLPDLIDPPALVATEPDDDLFTYLDLVDITETVPASTPPIVSQPLEPHGSITVADDVIDAMFTAPAPDDETSITHPTPAPDLDDGVDALYVRVVPRIGTELLQGESNAVEIAISDTPPPTAAPTAATAGISLDVTLTPPVAPNSNYRRCVRVVENPWGAANPVEPHVLASAGLAAGLVEQQYETTRSRAFVFENGAKVSKGLVPGATVCAHHVEDEPSFVETVVDAVATAIASAGYVWDLYVTLYEKMKDVAAEVLAELSGCNKLAELSQVEDADAACKVFAKQAINVVLASFGVPPTLPKYEDAVQLAKGEIKAALTDAIVQATGLDCDTFQQQCEELIEEAIGYLVDQAATEASNAAKQAAASGDGWYLHLNEQIEVVPEPVAMPPTAVIDFEITRSAATGAADPPPSCTYSAYVWGTKAQHNWRDYAEPSWRSESVTGLVMVPASASIDLTGLAPGESTGGTIVLDRLAEFYPPGQYPNQAGVPYDHQGHGAWIFLTNADFAGASTPTAIDVTLAGSPGCGTASNTFAVDGDANHPDDVVPYP